MVSFIVATTTDPASINPANALLSMAEWQAGPSFQVKLEYQVLSNAQWKESRILVDK